MPAVLRRQRPGRTTARAAASACSAPPTSRSRTRSVDAGVELISARHEGNAASMADAYAKATQELTLVSVHSGPGPHQRADRHRRGGQEPDAAAGAGRRRADRRGQVELLRRAGRDGALRRRHLGAHPHAGLAREDTLRAVDAGAARPPDGRAEPADRRAGRALRRQRSPPLALPPAPGPDASRSGERAPAGGCACKRASARSFSPVAAR